MMCAGTASWEARRSSSSMMRPSSTKPVSEQWKALAGAAHGTQALPGEVEQLGRGPGELRMREHLLHHARAAPALEVVGGARAVLQEVEHGGGGRVVAEEPGELLGRQQGVDPGVEGEPAGLDEAQHDRPR